jgi:hypothetical protein
MRHCEVVVGRRGSSWVVVGRRGSSWVVVGRRGSSWFVVVRRGSSWFVVGCRRLSWVAMSLSSGFCEQSRGDGALVARDLSAAQHTSSPS